MTIVTHPVCHVPVTYRRSSLPATLTNSVTIPAAQKDRMDADIQLAGVNPMVCPNEVHAEAHQDT
jgi:hypothetical protein